MQNTTSFTGGRTESVGMGLVHAVLHFTERSFRAWRNRRSITQLTEFDDHRLADLGLTRGDVDAALARSLLFDPSAELQRSARNNRRRFK